MTIRSVADARIIMFAIHAERRRSAPWATVQTFERHLEDMIATEMRGGKAIFVEDELARIERATELDGMGEESIERLRDFSERVREILENDDAR